MRLNLVVTLLIITFACTNQSKNEQILSKIEMQKVLVLELHDSVMLNLGDVTRIKKSLEKSLSDDEKESVLNQQFRLTIKDLQKAEDAMWDWMHNFDVAYQNQSDSLTLVYFESQFNKIDSVRVLFESSIKEGLKLQRTQVTK